MPDALVIRLDSNPGTVQYLLVDAAGGRLGAVLTGSLQQAASLATNRRVVALLPATEAVCAEPELPAKNAARLAQLAPFALEEQLADDIDKMHFAVGKRGANGKTPVAAIVRERLETWLAALGSAGIQPDAIYAESSVVPITAAGATLIIDRGLVYVRHARSPGFALDVQPLSEALQLALAGDPARGSSADGADAKHLLGDLQVYVTQSDYEQHRAACENLREFAPNLQIKLLPEGPLPLFALQTTDDSAINFLSGAYERKSSLAVSFAPWRYAAVLLGVVALLHLSYSGVKFWQSARAEREVDKQIREFVAQTLPGVVLKDTREARRQFEARLGAFRQNGAGSDLLEGLTTLGDALAQAPETHLDALAYRAHTIDLRVTAPNVPALDKIEQAIKAGGMSARLQSTTPRDDKVEGRLQLKSGV